MREVMVENRRSEGVLTPQIDPSEALKSEADFEEWSLGVYEWLGLVSLQSERVLQKDEVDPFLSRYRVPSLEDASSTANLVTLSWQGLIPMKWVRSVLIALKYVQALSSR